MKQAKADPEFALQFSADDIFNAAQFARRLQRPDIEAELVNAAFELDKSSASIRAQFLQLQAKDPRQDIRNAHFANLMGMLDEFSLDSPHTVVAEAWNAAEDQRRYSDLIEALDGLIAKLGTEPAAVVPSTVFAIKGNAHQRRGYPGELLIATKSYVDAIERLALEGTHTQWWEATIRNTLQGTQDLLSSGVDISAILLAAERSGVRPLQQRLERIRNSTSINASNAVEPVGGDADANEQMLQFLEMLRQLERTEE